jgi:hypothetical protein
MITEPTERPHNPYITMLTPETARLLQDNDLCRPSGFSIEFAEICARIVEADEQAASEMERAA